MFRVPKVAGLGCVSGATRCKIPSFSPTNDTLFIVFPKIWPHILHKPGGVTQQQNLIMRFADVKPLVKDGIKAFKVMKPLCIVSTIHSGILTGEMRMRKAQKRWSDRIIKCEKCSCQFPRRNNKQHQTALKGPKT